MTREHKFKVFTQGKMWKVLELAWDFSKALDQRGIDILMEDEEGNQFRDFIKNVDGLLEYTGLKDKNGVDIYEGDIVLDRRTYATSLAKLNLSQNNAFVDRFIVFWCQGEAQFRIKNNEFEIHYPLSDKQLEVIGNVYQNKELLNDN